MKRTKLINLQFILDLLFVIAYLTFSILLFTRIDNTYWAWFSTSSVVAIERIIVNVKWYYYYKFNKEYKKAFKNELN